jgi:hypothetical protein
MTMRKLSLMAGLVVLAGLALWPTARVTDAAPEPVPNWGAVKGRIVFFGDKVPERRPVDLGDKRDCAGCGPILEGKWVVNARNYGVRWAVVWLAADDNLRAPARKMPVHPKLARSGNAEAVVTVSCCTFEPHVLAMRDDQTLVFRNNSGVPHNVKYECPPPNPSGSPTIAPSGTDQVCGPVSYSWIPITLECNIHGWMQAYARVYDHPYFCVTDEDGNFEIKDAPAGEWFLNVWHEDVGIKGARTTLVGDKKVTRGGQRIKIQAGVVNKLDPIGISPGER